MDATAASTARDLKAAIQAQAAVPLTEQRLIHGENELDDERPLAAQGVTPMSPSMSLLRLASCKIYALGGRDGGQYLPNVEVFDLRTGAWAPLPPMTAHRYGLAAAVFDGKLYALGGFDGAQCLSSVEVFH